jgi:hypothetical protein
MRILVKYRKKPVVIEAMRYLGPFSYAEMSTAWGVSFRNHAVMTEGFLKIIDATGTHFPEIGDYIVKGTAGEFYPVSAKIFS